MEEIGAWFSMNDDERRAGMGEERRAIAREQVRWVRRDLPKANEMVQWTISSNERPKGRADLDASLADARIGQAFLSSLALAKKS